MAQTLNTIEGVATVVIAIYVASVGTVQWLTARDKVRLDLYDRRFDVYTRAIDFMQALMEWTNVTPEDRRAKRIAFISAVRQSRFRPATLDNQPVASPMNLTVVVQH